MSRIVNCYDCHSRDSSVSTVTVLRNGQPRKSASILAGINRLKSVPINFRPAAFSTLRHIRWVARIIFPGVNWSTNEADYLHLSVPRVGMSGVITPRPHSSSCRAQDNVSFVLLRC